MYLLDLGRSCFLTALLLHPAVQCCIFMETALPAFISDWLLRDQKVLLLRSLSPLMWVQSALQQAFQLPLAPFSLSYCSPLDRCLLWQVPFLPCGFLYSQVDKLC